MYEYHYKGSIETRGLHKSPTENILYPICTWFSMPTGFEKRVYSVVAEIPKGKVTTYKELAERLKIKGYRAIGNALNKNTSKEVPCHRVIKSDGSVGGFNRGVKKKIELLKREGVEIKKGKIDLKTNRFINNA